MAAQRCHPSVATGGAVCSYGRINGHAEAVDGAVFVAGMVSAAFRSTDSQAVVRDAARLVHPTSPYRQALDLVIAMAGAGRPPAWTRAASGCSTST